MSTLDVLNERFGLEDQLDFEKGPGGLPVARIANGHASARVALHGAHALSFQPHGKEEVLWLSRRSYFSVGKPIRGGIPICWPWFGEHPDDPKAASHGFARLSQWQVAAASVLPGGATRIEFHLLPDFHTRTAWPHDFGLSAVFTVGPSLDIELRTANTGNVRITISAALHTYLVVGDIGETTVHGLENARFFSKVEGGEFDAEGAPLRFKKETDRVYLDTEAACEVEDARLGRRIRVERRGSRSTVLWNPWTDKARRLQDLGEDQFADFVCVEAANALDDKRILGPGETHTLGTTISIV